jgi:hypothetical protein
MLDPENPRHDPVEGQRAAIEAMLDVEGQKILRLARHIAENGVNPLDRTCVIADGRNYIVLEGNRRLTALKLLGNPELAADTRFAGSAKRLKTSELVPSRIDCVIAPSREAARKWLELRHTGESGGLGVVGWNAIAQARFERNPKPQIAWAMAVIDELKATYGDDKTLGPLIERIEKGRPTTFGRLLQDPNFRDHIGIIGSPSEGLRFEFDAPTLKPVLGKVLGDFAGKVTVNQIKTKELRKDYMAKLPTPDPAKRLPSPVALGTKPPTANKAKNNTTQNPADTGDSQSTSSKPPKPAKPFKNLDLSNLGGKVEAILNEFKGLNVDKNPYSAAVLTRVILELAVDAFRAAHNRQPGDEKLKGRLKWCLKTLGDTGPTSLYPGVSKGLQDGTSLLAIATMHGYLHDPHFHPTGFDLRQIASNYEGFLQALNDQKP